ncbi:hypothetical protein [Ramlibacter sp.]|uniref:hypothetical protein n=1 Tax=Ramlibacter sp. TaxID=1917967 RepID=UPI001834F1CD|nr:hypothetical protein [Ramlibacter sp.]MBA2673795.1 hypothetical protein [Ramlibacter sp.]
MTFLRVLLAWLVMLAVPVQGFAATSMLMCDGGAGHHAAAQSKANRATAHDHGKHDHAGHAIHADAGHDHASHDQGHAKQAKAEIKKASDLQQKCSVCASACCHAVAITSTAVLQSASALPLIRIVEPFVAIHSRATTVPDKPPRA